MNNSSINSNHFKQSLDVLLVNLGRAWAIEYGLPIEPDIKAMLADLLQSKFRELLGKDDMDSLEKAIEYVEDQIKHGNKDMESVWKALKILRVDHL